MRRLKFWQSHTAFWLAMGLVSTTALPLLLARSVDAVPDPYLMGQRFPETWRNALPAGTRIPVEYDDAEKIILTPDETAPVTLTVSADVVNNSGRVIIPRGSQIEGELQPFDNGTRFEAETLIIDEDNRNELDAVSNVVTETEIITEKDDPNILRGAAIGGAAAAILSEIFGRIDAWEVLAGAGVGALAEVLLRGRKEVEVLVVYPEELDLRLRSEYAPNLGYTPRYTPNSQ